jgi:hypothetical protein
MCRLCSRRAFVQGSLSALVLGDSTGRASSAVDSEACAWNATDLGSYPRRSTSNNPDLDRALIAELKRILETIPVNPGFQFIEEDNPNAFALKASLISGTNGTVLIGLKLLNVLFQESQGGVSVAGVCAHECGHIYQYFSEFYDRLNGSSKIYLELHADCLAGFYMGKRKDTTADQIKLFTKTLVSFGGYDYGNEKFHGSPGQRAAAMEHGYMLAGKGVSFDDAAADGESYVKRL